MRDYSTKRGKMGISATPPKTNKINGLGGKNAPKNGISATPPKQLSLDINCTKVVNGIEMGVLYDGTSYLTLRGLATACGVDPAQITRITKEWDSAVESGIFRAGRVQFIASALEQTEYQGEKLFVLLEGKNGEVTHAYTSSVCTIILEYYAFESKLGSNDTARRSYRELARYGLEEYIKKALNYTPPKQYDPHQSFLERIDMMSLNDSVPDGYFIIFDEMTKFVPKMIALGVKVDSHSIPDISVGIAFAKYYAANLKAEHGPAGEHSHWYPASYPQAKSNPQVVKMYPDTALAAFRTWFRNVYLTTNFANYVRSKVKSGVVGIEVLEAIINKYPAIK